MKRGRVSPEGQEADVGSHPPSVVDVQPAPPRKRQRTEVIDGDRPSAEDAKFWKVAKTGQLGGFSSEEEGQRATRRITTGLAIGAKRIGAEGASGSFSFAPLGTKELSEINHMAAFLGVTAFRRMVQHDEGLWSPEGSEHLRLALGGIILLLPHLRSALVRNALSALEETLSQSSRGAAAVAALGAGGTAALLTALLRRAGGDKAFLRGSASRTAVMAAGVGSPSAIMSGICPLADSGNNGVLEAAAQCMLALAPRIAGRAKPEPHGSSSSGAPGKDGQDGDVAAGGGGAAGPSTTHTASDPSAARAIALLASLSACRSVAAKRTAGRAMAVLRGEARGASGGGGSRAGGRAGGVVAGARKSSGRPSGVGGSVSFREHLRRQRLLAAKQARAAASGGRGCAGDSRASGKGQKGAEGGVGGSRRRDAEPFVVASVPADSGKAGQPRVATAEGIAPDAGPSQHLAALAAGPSDGSGQGTGDGKARVGAAGRKDKKRGQREQSLAGLAFTPVALRVRRRRRGEAKQQPSGVESGSPAAASTEGF